jgi:hypothetical protein
VQFLIRSNIKTVFEFQRNWQVPVPGSTQLFRHYGFVAGIDYVF